MKHTIRILLRFVLPREASVRKINEKDPLTWEFSTFSQNGEDGIIDYLLSKINNPNKYFVEIGASNGLANNTAYLALVKKYCGIMVEGDKTKSKLSRILYQFFNKGVHSVNMFVTKENLRILLGRSTHSNPDVFSIDIDGNDFYLVESMLKLGFRPSIFVVEYNANFGPDKSITINYSPNFNYAKAHPSRLYYGASIGAWRNLFHKYDYGFVNVDSSGTNAFFVSINAFPDNFLINLKTVNFRDNAVELQTFEKPWDERFQLIENMTYCVV